MKESFFNEQTKDDITLNGAEAQEESSQASIEDGGKVDLLINTAIDSSSSIGNSDPEWKRRTMGMFPEGTSMRKVKLDTHSKSEYGEKTWTTGQTVRDILQNHLDANTQVFFDELISSVVDTGDVDRISEIMSDSQQAQAFDDFSYTLFRYRKSMPDLSDNSRLEFAEELRRLGAGLPLKKDLLTEEGGIDVEKMDLVIRDVEEQPPKLSYQIHDSQSGENTWISLEELSSPQYQEQQADNENFRFEIVSCRIEDDGKGFDSKLTAYYKSTKTGKRHLRGRFGEGTKMSETHLVRNRAAVKMRSVFQVGTDTGQRERLWQVRPSVDDQGKVELKGVKIDTHSGTSESQGSYTVISIRNASEDFAREFRRNIDPRTPDGIVANSLSFSPDRYRYPMGILRKDWKRPVGVCIDMNAPYQYVQGLRVGEADGGYGEPIFSYDFLDSSILKGRDRSELRDSLKSQIKGFWYNADSPELMRELVSQIWLEGRERNGTPPEFEALRDFIDYDSRHLSPQEQRAQAILFDTIPELVDLREGEKHVFVSDYQMRNPDNLALIHNLQNKGFRIVELQCTVVGENIDSLNAQYDGRYELLTLESAKEQANDLVSVLDAEDERTKTAQEIYRNAEENLRHLLDEVGYSDGGLQLAEPKLIEAVDGNGQPPVELEWLEDQGKFRLLLRPEVMKLGYDSKLGKDYWRRYTTVFMMASIGRSAEFPDRNTLLQHSQEVAQQILDLSITEGQIDFDELPDRFDHIQASASALDALNRFIEHIEKADRQMEAWNLLNEVRKLSPDSENFQAIQERLHELPGEYRQEVERVLQRRVVVENDSVHFHRHDRYGSTGELVSEKLSDLEVVASWQEHNVIRLDNKRFAVLVEIPDGSVVTMDEHHKYVYYDDTILNFERFHFGNYQYQSYPVTLEKGCIVVSIDPDKQDQLGAELEEKLGAVVIESPEDKSQEDMRQLSGTIDTPLPVEYGQSEWDNPIRVFQDIVQNHLDASPNRKGVSLRYEVERGDQKIWVEETGLTPEDQITGLTILDSGSGYLPNELGTMGNSSKKSPLFSGKYGEGQKMIAAAAARNGLDLFYSSIGKKAGQQYRWTARVDTRPEMLIVDGKQTQTERVIFQQDSQEISESPEQASTTTIRLPDDATGTQSELWNEWVKIVDPRIKDARGNGGLGRYVLDLRTGEDSDVIDLGYMRILLNEPGSIYENGLLVSYEQTDSDRTAVGYDVPEVVNTRERNSFDRRRLETYIGHAILECQDRRFSERLLTEFRDRHLSEAVSRGELPYILQLDLNLGSILMFERGMNPSRPYWDQANREILGGYIVHSDETLRQQIKLKRDDLSGRRGYVLDKEKGERQLEQLLSTLANIQHIPKDRIINVSDSYYDKWAKVLPTAESYTATLNQDAVSTNLGTISALRHLVVNSTSHIKASVDPLLESDNDETLTLDAILSGKKPTELDDWVVRSARHKASDLLTKWSSLQHIEENPDAVFVAPVHAGYLGIAERDRIGFNERLLVSDNPRELVGVSRHELIHKIFGIRDYTPEFVMLLHLLAEEGFKTQ